MRYCSTVFSKTYVPYTPGCGYLSAAKLNTNISRHFQFLEPVILTYPEAVYLQKEFGDGDKLIKRMIRDLIFMCPLRALASAWFSSGLPTFLYVFDFSYGLARWIGLGDFHGSELPFVFRNWLECLGQNKMQPTNPNAHTYVNGTDVKTHGYAVTHNTFLQ